LAGSTNRGEVKQLTARADKIRHLELAAALC